MRAVTLKSLIFLGILLMSFTASAQKKKVINYTEIGMLLNSTNSLDDGSEFTAFRTRTGISWMVNDNAGLGFALGTDNYRKSNGSNYNTIPLSLNASWYPNSDFTGLRADIYGGYSVKIFSNHNKGLMAGAGLGYGFSVNSRLNLGIQTGYNYQEIDFPSSVIANSFNMGTIRLGLGITFK